MFAAGHRIFNVLVTCPHGKTFHDDWAAARLRPDEQLPDQQMDQHLPQRAYRSSPPQAPQTVHPANHSVSGSQQHPGVVRVAGAAFKCGRNTLSSGEFVAQVRCLSC